MLSNNIGDEGAIILADILRYNNTVQKINLGHNNIGDEGAIAIAHMLRSNTSIREIDLRGNNIGKEGAIALADMLRYKRVQSLPVGFVSSQRVSKLYNTTVREIYLDYLFPVARIYNRNDM